MCPCRATRHRGVAPHPLLREHPRLRATADQPLRRRVGSCIERALRGRANESGALNQAQHTYSVLPVGHEVKPWHGRKEHMEAHSPVLPPPVGRSSRTCL